MSRIAYVNGRYLPHGRARIHIEDRGLQFADGVYEVVAIRDGRAVDLDGHLDRLAYSLAELEIPWPVAGGRPVLEGILAECRRRNGLRDALIHIQVTRGGARRDFVPPAGLRPSLMITLRPVDFSLGGRAEQGVAVITVPDQRWARRDIKSTALLPQVLAKRAAARAGAFEAWMTAADGTITEGAASNAWIVTAAGELITRRPDRTILKGVTRQALESLCRAEGLALIERPFTAAEARAAREAFLTSATSFVLPVVALDGVPIGEGRPGPMSGRLRASYIAGLAARGGAGWTPPELTDPAAPVSAPPDAAG